VNPNIMDVKLGTRQHRDTETEEKQKRKAARCKDSTSASLGLRIHGISMYSIGERKMVLRDKYWGRVLDDSGVFRALREFIDAPVADPSYVVSKIVSRLELITDCVEAVNWRFYGSSILIVFDSQVEQPAVHVRLIDFGSCDMNSTNSLPGYDEGFVFGLKTLMEGFQRGLRDIGLTRGIDLDLKQEFATNSGDDAKTDDSQTIETLNTSTLTTVKSMLSVEEAKAE